MKERRSIFPYMAGSSSDINGSLSLMKIYKRIRTLAPTCKPGSRYEWRLKSRKSVQRIKLHIVRTLGDVKRRKKLSESKQD